MQRESFLSCPVLHGGLQEEYNVSRLSFAATALFLAAQGTSMLATVPSSDGHAGELDSFGMG